MNAKFKTLGTCGMLYIYENNKLINAIPCDNYKQSKQIATQYGVNEVGK